MKAREAMSDSRPAIVTAGEGLVSVFAKYTGDAVQIGNYGVATASVPAFVPAAEVEAICAEGRLYAGPLSLEELPGGETVVHQEFHADGGTVYHDSPGCSLGNNIETENRREGRGGLKRCAECRKQARKGEEK